MDISTSDLEAIGIAMLAGLGLGMLFFGGLWLTLHRWVCRKGTGASLYLLASFLVRSGVLMLGLWWVGRGDPLRMFACAGGILGSRWLLVRRLYASSGASLKQEPRC